MSSRPILLLATLLAASAFLNFYQFKHRGSESEASVLHVKAADAPLLMRTNGGLLEVSAIKVTEQFDATTAHRLLGAPLGKTITQIRVPATYRYQIELAREWKIHIRDGKFIVLAPAVRPSLPIAIDTALLEKNSSGLWSPFVGTTSLDKLQRAVSPTLAARATQATYLSLQRETARQTVKEFVSKWLITQAEWKKVSNYPVHVFFADEPISLLTTAVPM